MSCNFLDLTASFAHVIGPTPFGIFDSDTAFKADADSLVELANIKFGGSVLNVEITNKDVYACFEEAALEYSAIINTYQAKSVLADIMGSQTGSLTGQQNKFPRFDLNLAKRRADSYSTEAGVGGTRTLYSASITSVIGQQKYNLNALLSSSGLVVPPNQRAEIREIFHFSPTAAYRFFDTTSAINYLHNQFKFESFTPETVFYLLPIWEDVLRAQQLEMSHKIRRSNYSFLVQNNVLSLYPCPTSETKIFFTYYLNGSDTPYNENDPFTNGVSNLSNVPFGNINYSQVNSIGRQWMRRFALALSKEVLGQVRGKISSIPIPNNELTLNGSDLISQGKNEQDTLREELKLFLDSMTYDKLAATEREQADNTMHQLQKIPLGIFCGILWTFVLM